MSTCEGLRTAPSTCKLSTHWIYGYYHYYHDYCHTRFSGSPCRCDLKLQPHTPNDRARKKLTNGKGPESRSGWTCDFQSRLEAPRVPGRLMGCPWDVAGRKFGRSHEHLAAQGSLRAHGHAAGGQSSHGPVPPHPTQRSCPFLTIRCRWGVL